ncbi:DUF5694 domain-containing protein [Maricaulis sp. CAU 1757]
MLRSIVMAAAVLLLPGQSLAGQGLPERPEPVAEVLILGTYHFANPGRDQFNAEADDMLSPRRQAEIAALIDALAEFAPTQIAVEALPGAGINERYRAWRAGDAELTANETEQIGFRLAHRMGLNGLALVDADHPFLAYEDLLLAYGELAGGVDDPRLVQVEADRAELGRGFTAETERRQAAHSVGEVLAWLNSDTALDANADFYLAHRIRRWAPDGGAAGAYTVGNWYTRNILILQNVLRLVEGGQDERVLLVIGQGHAAILRDLVAQSPWLELVDPLSYLPAVPDGP